MRISKLLYVGFYAKPDDVYKRSYNIAAVRKMDFVAKVMSEATGENVHIVSPAYIQTNKCLDKRYVKGYTVALNDYTSLSMTPSWESGFRAGARFRLIFSLLWLTMYLLVHTDKNTNVIVYHVPFLSLPVRIAKMIKRFRLTLEVEEIYCEIWEKYKKYKKQEMKAFRAADTYIFASQLMQEKVFWGAKKSLVIHGEYAPVLKPEKTGDKIGIIYAGSIDSVKGGAVNAVLSMDFLPNKYYLNILGYGDTKDIEELNKLINEINERKGYQCCCYLGLKYGDEFSNILLRHDIGLNPQYIGDYMETAFPSKVMVYLNHGLKVVSTRIKSIEYSNVSSLVSFCDSCRPQDIANAISSVTGNTDVIETISALHEHVVAELKEILICNDNA